MEYSKEIFNFLSGIIPSGKVVQRRYQSPNEKKKKRNRLDIIRGGDLRLTLTKLTSNVDNVLLNSSFSLKILIYCLCYFIYILFYVYFMLLIFHIIDTKFYFE